MTPAKVPLQWAIAASDCTPWMPDSAWKNKLFFGDNLDILRKYRREIPDESVDLIYLDPPFNSNATYNVLFKQRSGLPAASQLRAYGDTWRWDSEASESYFSTVNHGPEHVSRALQSFRTILGDSNMLAYLSMMAPRLVELHRVLKSTGSIYLHCDTTASHYLKLLMDAVFRPDHFRSEITWKRTNVHNDSKDWSNVTDILLYYVKTSSQFTWNPLYLKHSQAHIDSKYREDEDGRMFTLSDMRSPRPRPNLIYEWKGFSPPPNGWAYSRETMQKLDSEGRIWYPSSLAKRPRLKRYLDEMKGNALTNIWTDIHPLNSQAQERLGYQTQKPEALLGRIIRASSNPGDVILDPFCGCGTTISAAENLNRRWIGIDIAQPAIVVIKQQRLTTILESTYEVIGEPASLEDAQALARQDRYEFQWWVVARLGAQAIERKKGKDKGIDGRLTFHDDSKAEAKRIIISVKSGHPLIKDVRELRGVVERERAAIGALVNLEKPTAGMRAEAASAGYYSPPWGRKRYPRLQLIGVADLFAGKDIDRPRDEAQNITFEGSVRKPPASQKRKSDEGELFPRRA